MALERTRNRGIGRDGYAALKASGRIGPHGRSFHFRVAPARRGGDKMRYAHRLDGARTEELESRDQVLDVDAFEAMADDRERDLAGTGQAAVYTIEMELPRELSPAGREWVCTALTGLIETGTFAGADAPAKFAGTWAVHHTNQKGEDQPHGHFVFLAGAGGARPIEGAMKQLRHAAADLINQVGRHEGLELHWHGGTLADTGLDRAPRRRIHTALWKAREDRDAGKPLSPSRMRLAAAADRLEAMHGKPTKDDRLKAADALRDIGGALPLDIHEELDRRGLTTKRRAQAEINRLERELQQARAAAQKAQGRPQASPPAPPPPAKPSARVSALQSRPVAAAPLHLDPADPSTVQDAATRRLTDDQVLAATEANRVALALLPRVGENISMTDGQKRLQLQTGLRALHRAKEARGLEQDDAIRSGPFRPSRDRSR